MSTLRCGITDNWDVGLSIPVVNTFLRVRNEKVQVLDVDPSKAGYVCKVNMQTGDRIEELGSFDSNGRCIGDRTKGCIPETLEDRKRLPHVKAQSPSTTVNRAAGSATGVGDITLRTKYYFWRNELGGAAFGLNLQLPSGEVRDFHGTGETHLSTLLYLSQVLWDRFEPHLNIGVDFNTDDVDRSSFLYAAGATLLVGTKLGLVVDFIGRNEFSGFPVHVPPQGRVMGLVPDVAPDTCTAEKPCIFGPDRVTEFPLFSAKIGRNDIADFSFGLRYPLGTASSIFFGGIVPLNDDGFRPDFIPSGGVEYTF
jgi:hypothetical protein